MPMPRYLLTAPPPPRLHTLSLHDALPIWGPSGGDSTPHAGRGGRPIGAPWGGREGGRRDEPSRGPHARSEEHTSELQSLRHLVCRLLLQKKKRIRTTTQVPRHANTNTNAR